MYNFVTNYEYTGQNEQTLFALGFDENDSFVTFKQAIKLPGMSGAKMKGLKAAARLVRFNNIKDENGEVASKKVPVYFSVFHAEEVLKRAAA